MDIFAFWKQNWSKPVDEDNVIFHIGTESPFCGIDKKGGIYNQGFDQLENIENQKIHICKKCYHIWEKNYKDKEK